MRDIVLAGVLFVCSAVIVGGWLGLVLLEARAIAGLR